MLLVGLCRCSARRDVLRSSSRPTHEYSAAGYNYSTPLLGIQVPIVIGIGGLLLGVLLMLVAWPVQREFFQPSPANGGPGNPR